MFVVVVVVVVVDAQGFSLKPMDKFSHIKQYLNSSFSFFFILNVCSFGFNNNSLFSEK